MIIPAAPQVCSLLLRQVGVLTRSRSAQSVSLLILGIQTRATILITGHHPHQAIVLLVRNHGLGKEELVALITGLHSFRA